MRIVVFSDTHGNSFAVHNVLKKNEDAAFFIFLGDGEYDVSRARALFPNVTVLSVAGNCDYASSLPDRDIAMAGDVKIFFTHGHKMGVKYSVDRLFNTAKSINARIALFGHTHCRFYEYRDGVHILNPGSASCPRDGKHPSYAFIDVTPKGIFCSHADL